MELKLQYDTIITEAISDITRLQHLKRVDTSEFQAQMTLSLYDKLDKCIDIFLLDTEVECKKGCAACCHQQVIATDGEVWAAVEWIVSQEKRFFSRLMRKLNCFERKVHSLYEKYPDLSGDKGNQAAEEYYAKRISCPFLEKALCSIYPVRPTECRLFYTIKRKGEVCPYFTGIEGLKVNLNISPARAIENTYINAIYGEEERIYVAVFPLQVHHAFEVIAEKSHELAKQIN